MTPYVTSATQDLAPQPTISLANTVTIPAQSIASYVSPSANVSVRQPDGMILSTGNIYLTSHDAAGPHVYRTGQTSTPGQEIELYKEGPGNRFGDIVFAKIGNVYYGYFRATNSTGKSSIKRILLTGSKVATVLTPALSNIDIVNSHHNLATDGVNLYWQDVSSVKKMPIGGGAITTLDQTTPNTPTAGVYLGAIRANERRQYPSIGEDDRQCQRDSDDYLAGSQRHLLGRPQRRSTAQRGFNDFHSSGRCGIGSDVDRSEWLHCRRGIGMDAVRFIDLPNRLRFSCRQLGQPGANNALDAAISSAGSVFWGDDYGVHRLDF